MKHFHKIVPRLDPSRRPGVPGRIVILLDKSGSVPDCLKRQMDRCVDWMRRRHGEHYKVYEFHFGISEFNPPYDDDTRPSFFRKFTSPNDTQIGLSLSQIEHLNPSKTLLFSDGSCCDGGLALRVASRITGDIDCFYANATATMHEYDCPSYWTKEECRQYVRNLIGYKNPGLLQKIARYGSGSYFEFDDKTDIPGIIAEQMRRPVAEIPQKIAEKRMPSDIGRHGQPSRGTIRVGGSKITVERPEAIRVIVRPSAAVRRQHVRPHAPLQVEYKPEMPVNFDRQGEKKRRGWFW